MEVPFTNRRMEIQSNDVPPVSMSWTSIQGRTYFTGYRVREACPWGAKPGMTRDLFNQHQNPYLYSSGGVGIL